MNTSITEDRDGFVVTLTLQRPPHNFVDALALRELANALDKLDDDDGCRAIVFAAKGTSFCAGADFSVVQSGDQPPDAADLYQYAMRLFESRKPVVAAVHGAAIGAGFGLALVAEATLRSDLARTVREFNGRELAEQQVQFRSDDFHEALRAMAERRTPRFIGR